MPGGAARWGGGATVTFDEGVIEGVDEEPESS
jgi:hypothetical protein